MFHYLFSGLALIATVFLFNQQYCMKGSMNAYFGLYRGAFDSSVISLSSTGEKIYPYFELNELHSQLDRYFERNLKPYCRYYTYEINGSKYMSEFGPSKVVLDLSVKIDDFSSLNKSAVFEIRRNANE